ncbi:MAG: HD domain-containing protein [Clostridiaceae bacterium]|jgi:exopolyphosphatase/guanosine-5'-triphosphate,3'-diphosphate pyrophosphatase|nr:HD domain-containing protein [Bacillota bacterium]NLN52001.1 HD domain-containing protein [Clostridiaceae bacterium]
MSEQVSFLAAIEVGSHEAILKIAQVLTNGNISEVESMSRTINLGSNSYRLGYITKDNVDLLIDTLKDFRRIISMYPEIEVIAACTSAIREADNRLFILDQIRRQTGFKIEIYSNRMEIDGMLKAIRLKMPEFDQLTKDLTLLLDIGAGSTQLTLFDDQEFTFTQNILLGSLRVRDRLAILEQHTADFINLMQEYISGDIDYYRSFVPKRTNYQHFVLVGNDLDTWRYLANLPFVGTAKLTVEKFNELFNIIIQSSSLELIHKFDINEEQASLLLPVAMVIKELFEFTGLEYLVMPEAILSDGLIVKLAQDLNLIEQDSRSIQDTISFAKQIVKRFHPDFKHIEQVERLSLQLFDQLQKLHGLSKRQRFLLQIAANLHNIGKFFSVKQDDEMAYQMIKSSDLVGLTDQEIEMIALLVKHHNDDFFTLAAVNPQLSPEDQVDFVKMVVLLSMANTLDTGHLSKIKNIRTDRHKRHIKVKLESNKDLTLESWSFQKPAQAFQEIFGTELRLSVVPVGELELNK